MVFPSAKDPASLSSIYVPREPSPVKTDWIHPRVEINDRYFIIVMCVGGNKIKVLANKCHDIDKACHAYFLGTCKSFVNNYYKF